MLSTNMCVAYTYCTREKIHWGPKASHHIQNLEINRQLMLIQNI